MFWYAKALLAVFASPILLLAGEAIPIPVDDGQNVVIHWIDPDTKQVFLSKPQPIVVQKQPTTATVTYVGHTHTCRNGHTWDHSTNPTHNCRICGLYQNVVDQPRVIFQQPRIIYQQQQPLYQVPGCSTGNCPIR